MSKSPLSHLIGTASIHRVDFSSKEVSGNSEYRFRLNFNLKFPVYNYCLFTYKFRRTFTIILSFASCFFNLLFNFRLFNNLMFCFYHGHIMIFEDNTFLVILRNEKTYITNLTII